MALSTDPVPGPNPRSDPNPNPGPNPNPYQVRDAPNAADFVLSFWVGWLHARLPLSSRIVLASADIHLERTVVDVLRQEGRETIANPDWLSAIPSSAPGPADVAADKDVL